MITYIWTYRCDYCKKEVESSTKFHYYPGQDLIRPGIIPELSEHGRWRNVDGLLVCPKHKVTVDE